MKVHSPNRTSKKSLVASLPLVLLASTFLSGCGHDLAAPTLFPRETLESHYRYDEAHDLRVGEGVERDHARAGSLLHKLASQGDTRAMNDLGIMFAQGQGVRRSYDEAHSWFTRSADKGNSQARYNLALMSLYGLGTRQDTERAILLLHDSAMQGNQRAQVLLADIYSSSAVQNLQGEALRLYRRAAEGGQLDDWLYMARTPEGKWLRDLKQRPTNADHLISNMLVDSYRGFEGTHHQYKRAREKREVYSLRTKAREGDAVAQYNLGLRYFLGNGVPSDHKEAARWITLSAHKDYAPAQIKLANMYMMGDGVQPHAIAAYHWFSRASVTEDKQLSQLARRSLDELERRMSPEAITYAQNWSEKMALVR